MKDQRGYTTITIAQYTSAQNVKFSSQIKFFPFRNTEIPLNSLTIFPA